MNTQKLRTKLREILTLHAYDIGDLSDRIDELFAEFESQPLAGVVPAIEWEQDTEDDRWWYGKGFDDMYSIKKFGNGFIPKRGSDTVQAGGCKTFEEAIAACQAHKQAAITKALEGCKVVVWRDPKPLLSALRIIRHRPTQGGFAEHIVNSIKATADEALTAWEEGK